MLITTHKRSQRGQVEIARWPWAMVVCSHTLLFGQLASNNMNRYSDLVVHFTHTRSEGRWYVQRCLGRLWYVWYYGVPDSKHELTPLVWSSHNMYMQQSPRESPARPWGIRVSTATTCIYSIGFNTSVRTLSYPMHTYIHVARAEGASSVAIGASAVASANNTIVLNAQGWSSKLNGTTPNAFYVAPVRSAAATANTLYYDSDTKEVTYGPGPVPPGTSTGDYLVWDAAVGAWTVGNTSVELGSGADAAGLSTVAVGSQGEWRGRT